MKFHIITVFPKSFNSYLQTSILKRAQDRNVFEPVFYNLCDYSVKNTRRIDSRPFGGLPGTIFSPEPLANAINNIQGKYGKLDIIYFSPRGKRFKQQMAEKFAKGSKDYILICGHYEGIDERIVELFNIKQVSIGDFVLTSGELATMVFMDSIVRLIPGVISSESIQEESFSKKLGRKKEYPQYTRPEEFMGKKVPSELLSGNPKTIENWKKNYL